MESQQVFTQANISIKDKQVTVSQQYSANTKTAQTLQRIVDIIGQSQVEQLDWKWGNKLSTEEITKLIQILPQKLTKISISGSTRVSSANFEQLILKLQNLKHINLYNNTEDQANWDIEYQVQIKNSMKLFRESQKWSASLSKDISKFTLGLQNLPQTLTNLTLRNTGIGKVDKTILKTLFTKCANLTYVDLGQTLITDSHFQNIPQPTLANLSNQLVTLKLDCNRLTKKTLQLIFPSICSNSQQKSRQYQLKVLDIGKTNMVQVYEDLLLSFPSLEYLGLAYLEISDEEVVNFTQRNSQNKHHLQELDIEFGCFSPETLALLLQSFPDLHSVSMPSVSPKEGQKYEKMDLDFTQNSKLKRVNANNNAYFCGNKSLKSLILSNPHLQILKVSSTKISAQALIDLCSQCKDLKWLEISYLGYLQLSIKTIQTQQNSPKQAEQKSEVPQISQQAKEQQKECSQKVLKSSQILDHLIHNFPKLWYLEAYDLLNAEEAKSMKQESAKLNEKLVLALNPIP